MIPRASRFAIWCIALLVSLLLYARGRVPAAKEGDAALFRPAPGTVTVRLAGDFPRPGLYRLPAGTTAAAAIKMTLPKAPPSVLSASKNTGLLHSGDIVTVGSAAGQAASFSVTAMAARERMLVGIPLDPDQLGQDDWDALPGIGPLLAARITADRQKNGAFRSLKGLLRVPGIGRGKLAALRKYF